MLKWLVAPKAPVIVDIQFRLKDRNFVPWRENGKNLRSLPDGLLLQLENSDWQKR
jgi:hypothetical protein